MGRALFVLTHHRAVIFRPVLLGDVDRETALQSFFQVRATWVVSGGKCDEQGGSAAGADSGNVALAIGPDLTNVEQMVLATG